MSAPPSRSSEDRSSSYRGSNLGTGSSSRRYGSSADAPLGSVSDHAASSRVSRGSRAVRRGSGTMERQRTDLDQELNLQEEEGEDDDDEITPGNLVLGFEHRRRNSVQLRRQEREEDAAAAAASRSRRRSSAAEHLTTSSYESFQQGRSGMTENRIQGSTATTSSATGVEESLPSTARKTAYAQALQRERARRGEPDDAAILPTAGPEDMTGLGRSDPTGMTDEEPRLRERSGADKSSRRSSRKKTSSRDDDDSKDKKERRRSSRKHREKHGDESAPADEKDKSSSKDKKERRRSSRKHREKHGEESTADDSRTPEHKSSSSRRRSDPIPHVESEGRKSRHHHEHRHRRSSDPDSIGRHAERHRSLDSEPVRSRRALPASEHRATQDDAERVLPERRPVRTNSGDSSLSSENRSKSKTARALRLERIEKQLGQVSRMSENQEEKSVRNESGSSELRMDSRSSSHSTSFRALASAPTTAEVEAPSFVREQALKEPERDFSSDARRSFKERMRERMSDTGTGGTIVDRSKSPIESEQGTPQWGKSNEYDAVEEPLEKESTIRSQALAVSVTSSSDSDTEDDSTLNDEDDYIVESSAEDDEECWTLRVNLISAADLPPNVVPNLPLCPVVKVGLVAFPEGDAAAESSRSKLEIMARIEKSGLISIPKARVRCSSNKILSKRDSGSMDFYEEMRWDKVKRPQKTALAIQLCARAAAPPPNAKESPLVATDSPPQTREGPHAFNSRASSMSSKDANQTGKPDFRRIQSLDASASQSTSPDGLLNATWNKGDASKSVNQRLFNLSDFTKGSTLPVRSEQSSDTPSSGQEEDLAVPAPGLVGMRALWRKGRQQFDIRQATKRKSASPTNMETTGAAAAMARLSNSEIDGEQNSPNDQPGSSRSLPETEGVTANGSSIGDRKSPPLPFSHYKAPSEGENVALRPRKRQKIEIAKDVHIGSLLIPLTQLPLEKATHGKEAARIEQWFELDFAENSVLQPPSSPTATWRRESVTKSSIRRPPSVLVEVSFSSPEILDESEDEMDGDEAEGDNSQKESLGMNRSFSRRTSLEMKASEPGTSSSSQATSTPKKSQQDDPLLEPGVIDFIAVVGASNVGDQKNDDGSRGWVNTFPECGVLEQFPPNDEFHIKNGRNTTLSDKKVEWFCFPDGWKLWRGSEPPTHSDLNLKRFSSATAANVSSSMPAFDACLNCTTSFSWFVLASNSDDYGSSIAKTYGAVIRFYAPAPPGIDLTQDDYAQPLDQTEKKNVATSMAKRLWVPMGICRTSSLPIVGIMEAMLLRICQSLAARTGPSLHSTTSKRIQDMIRQDLANLIINFQKPIPGVLHCSIPFLSGERLHLTLPPPTGLPPLPHGASITSTCRLLGSEGLNILLAAALTECKILIHSYEVANLGMVAEVITALIYPFEWSLPYIPVLPDAMLEFIEAPLSYMFGVPTSSMKLIDPSALADTVVIDLDNGFSSPDSYAGRRGSKATKTPTPLPSSVAASLTKSVFRLLREEEEVQEEYGSSSFRGSRVLPRLEAENLAEREFRIAVAMQVCSLVRGYDDCLFKFSASQPVFNIEKFLRTAPALFDSQRGNLPSSSTGQGPAPSPRTLSPRSKRFLSILVKCQHFHQFLETLDHDRCSFFNEVMSTLDVGNESQDDLVASTYARNYGASKVEEAMSNLSKALQKVEDKIPTYRVERTPKNGRRSSSAWDDDIDDVDASLEGLMESTEGEPDADFPSKSSQNPSFTDGLLQQIGDQQMTSLASQEQRNSQVDDEVSVASNQSDGVRSLSVQYLMELENNNWRYTQIFDIPVQNDSGVETTEFVKSWDKVKLKEAIGERRYRAWKLAQEQKNLQTDSSTKAFKGDVISTDGNISLDLTSLLSSAEDDASGDTSLTMQSTSLSITQSSKRSSTLSPEQQRVVDAKDRDVLRRCLERAYEGTQRRPSRAIRRTSMAQSTSEGFFDKGRDLVSEAEVALKNPSAQKFLLHVLGQRSRTLENQRRRRQNMEGGRRQANQSSVSRLEPTAFDCLFRLCCAMLDACLESKDYEPAYELLQQTVGFCSVVSQTGQPMTSRDLELSHEQEHKVVYMTAKIGLHPIFANMGLWEEVLSLHLKGRENDRSSGSVAPSPNFVDRSFLSDMPTPTSAVAGSDLAEYEAAVATLYEMLGFGIPAEELARFATFISEERGWFATERGHSLVMLARRLTVRREQGDEAVAAGDLEMMSSGKKDDTRGYTNSMTADSEDEIVDGVKEALYWNAVGWCHPAALSSSRTSGHFQQDSSTVLGSCDRPEYLKRAAVTSMAAFGSSVVASGGLDGSVFVAHTIQFPSDDDGQQHDAVVRGARLDWGSSGSKAAGIGSISSSKDGEYGVGAVSCLAAAKGAGYRQNALTTVSSRNRDVSGGSDEDDFLAAMEGCRVVAGTTAGDLRVWSVKDVYAATVLASRSDEAGLKDTSTALSQIRSSHGSGEGLTSSYVLTNQRGSITDIAAGNAYSRMKFTLRGRQLSEHRGGVCCIDIPSHVYRPDSILTGGADGLIRLVSLRQPVSGRRGSGDNLAASAGRFSASSLVATSGAGRSQVRGKARRTGDAVSILTGHTGRVLCVRSAWNGDRLLSGGSDRTVRVWDLGGSSGKCLHTLSGHLGWVTHATYWGQNTIVSASTDRSVALWDARLRSSPLFVLRYHHCPVSDLLVGGRTDPLMVSASGDGTIATWDFRSLSGSGGDSMPTAKTSSGTNKCTPVRSPAATMDHNANGRAVKQAGPILLARGISSTRKSIMSVGLDAVVREWDLITGRLVKEENSGHCDVVSSLTTFSDASNNSSGAGFESGESEATPTTGGIITSSWDGTLRMRKFIRN